MTLFHEREAQGDAESLRLLARLFKNIGAVAFNVFVWLVEGGRDRRLLPTDRPTEHTHTLKKKSPQKNKNAPEGPAPPLSPPNHNRAPRPPDQPLHPLTHHTHMPFFPPIQRTPRNTVLLNDLHLSEALIQRAMFLELAAVMECTSIPPLSYLYVCEYIYIRACALA